MIRVDICNKHIKGRLHVSISLISDGACCLYVLFGQWTKLEYCDNGNEKGCSTSGGHLPNWVSNSTETSYRPALAQYERTYSQMFNGKPAAMTLLVSMCVRACVRARECVMYLLIHMYMYVYVSVYAGERGMARVRAGGNDKQHPLALLSTIQRSTISLSASGDHVRVSRCFHVFSSSFCVNHINTLVFRRVLRREEQEQEEHLLVAVMALKNSRLNTHTHTHIYLHTHM